MFGLMNPLHRLKLSRLHLSKISLRDAMATILPLIALVMLAFWFAYQFVKPAPPGSFIMTTGSEDGAYHGFAKRYQEILARNGITMELRTSAGSVENLERLGQALATEEGAEAGLVQAGSGEPADYPGLLTLGSVYYEPVWVFYRGDEIEDRLSQLRGRRIAIGPIGSGARKLATQLLLVNQAWSPPTRISDLGGDAAAKALLAGGVDAVFLIGPAESPTITQLLNDERVRLLSFDRAAAYTKAFPFLSAVKLPEGGINLLRNIPSREVTLLAPTANIMVTEEFHPALAGLLLQAMSEVHGGHGIFQKAGEFPALREAEFPASPEAQRYYKSGPPFLQRYLPFWAATLFDRIIVLLVPLIAVMIPAIKLTPMLYTWRIRSRIYRWYGELKLLELELKDRFDAAQMEDYLKRLDDLEQRACTRPLPIAFSVEVYTLRQHIGMVRASLRMHRPANIASPVTAEL